MAGVNVEEISMLETVVVVFIAAGLVYFICRLSVE